MNAVQHEPLSWLMLERYALGELPAEMVQEVEARLLVSEADRRCLDEIRRDAFALPDLSPRRSLAVQRVTWAGYAGLLAAASVLLLLRAPHFTMSGDAGVKGEDVALALLSDRMGEHPKTFARDERFKVLVTCPPEFRGVLRVLVFQGARRFEPVTVPEELGCGNHVPVPGAFSLSEHAPAEVCVTWSPRASRAQSSADLAPEAACTLLHARE